MLIMQNATLHQDSQEHCLLKIGLLRP